MHNEKKSRKELVALVEELSRRLEESEDVLEAIRRGAIDAVVVATSEGEKIYTLQGAEHSYRMLVETMNEGAVTLSLDGTILYCNRRFAEMLGYPQQKIVGSALRSYLPKTEYPLFSSHLQKCVAEHEKHEISLIAKRGERLPVLISCAEAEFGGSKAISIIITDISSRKQAERTILRLNRLYAVLSAISHAIVHASAPLSIFQEFCRVAVELGGFRLAWVGLVQSGSQTVEVAAASGETGYLEGLELSADPDSKGMGPIATTLLEGSHSICNDFSADAVADRWRQRAHAFGFHAVASIAIKEEETVVGALTLYADEKDFFDRQQVELLQQMGAEVSFALDNIRHSFMRNETERALQDATNEKLRAVEELRKNEQMLIHQSRQAALGEMIGNIAHQWRQPLNSLGLLVQQAPIYYSLGEVNQEFLEQTAAKSMELIEHMSRTIDDFRNFFKPDKEKTAFNVTEEVVKTISLMEGSLKGQRIRIEVEVKAKPVVQGYPNEFAQVLLNILFNARDALTERQVADPKVTIRVDKENTRAVITVVDNAGGIPGEIIDRIFDPYFTTKGPQAGTGVGLFMSKTIIERNMGGSLSVRNTAEGAEFRIEI